MATSPQHGRRTKRTMEEVQAIGMLVGEEIHTCNFCKGTGTHAAWADNQCRWCVGWGFHGLKEHGLPQLAPKTLSILEAEEDK